MEKSRRAWMHVPAIVTLTALNLAICWRLFKVEYTDHFSSIEGAWVGLARYISRHWGDFSWFPLWHCGMPFQDTYVPLLHLTVAATATLGRMSAAHAYHAVCGVTYALGAATLYVMAHRLGAGKGAAFTAGLFYSLLSPCTFLLPEMARDIGGVWYSRRLQVMVVYGEGPHVSAITLLPLAIAGLQYAVEKRTRRALALAAAALGLVFVTNVPGTMGTAMAVFCWLCVQAPGQRRASWSIAGAATVLAYAVDCYALPPSSLRTVFGNVGQMHAGFSATLRLGPALLLLTLAATAAVGWLMARTRMPLALRFAALYFAVLLLMVKTAKPNSFELLPQVGRLHLEMEIGMCILLGAGAWRLYRLIPSWLRPLVLMLCLAPVYLQYMNYRSRAYLDTKPVNVSQRSEYTSARWVDTNLPGQRVYAAGSTSFWWSAFTDNPQLIGCCAQNQSMPILDAVPYLINIPGSVNDTAMMGPYLQALGVQAMVAPGPQSTDEYKDIAKPERFDALFPTLHRESGDTIYRIPQRTTSLAHVVRTGDVVPPGASASEVAKSADILRYAAALQDEGHPAARMNWLRGDTARIHAVMQPGDLVSVQAAWFRGWNAYVVGRRIEVTRDGLGFMLLHPECSGNCEITLHWAGRVDSVFAMMISVAGLIFWLWWIAGARPELPRWLS